MIRCKLPNAIFNKLATFWRVLDQALYRAKCQCVAVIALSDAVEDVVLEILHAKLVR